jgi:hypothetical protein
MDSPDPRTWAVGCKKWRELELFKEANSADLPRKRMRADLPRLWRMEPWWLALVVCWQATLLPFQAATEESFNDQGQPWRVLSFAEDAELAGKNVFHIDFQRGENPSTLEKVWLATSGGLQEYDGYNWRQHGVAQGIAERFHPLRVGDPPRRFVGRDRPRRGNLRRQNVPAPRHGNEPRRPQRPTDGRRHRRNDLVLQRSVAEFRPQRRVDLPARRKVVGVYGEGRIAQRIRGQFFQGLLRPPVGGDEGRHREVGRFELGDVARARKLGGIVSHRAVLRRLRDVRSCSRRVPMSTCLLNNVWARQPVSTKYPHHQHGICIDEGRKDPQQCFHESRPEDYFGVGQRGVGRRVGRVRSAARLQRGHPRVSRRKHLGDWIRDRHLLAAARPMGSVPQRSASEVRRAVEPDLVWQGWLGRSAGGDAGAVRARPTGSGWSRLTTIVFPDGTGGVWGWASNGVTRWVGTNTTLFTESDTGLNVIHAGRMRASRRVLVGGTESKRPAGNRVFLSTDVGSNTPCRTFQGTFAKPGIAALRDSLWMISRPSARTNAVAIKISPDQTTLGGGASPPFSANSITGCMSARMVPPFGCTATTACIERTSGTGRWEAITNLPGRTVVGLVERGNEVWVGCNGATGGSVGLARYRDGEWKTFPIRSLMNHLARRGPELC